MSATPSFSRAVQEQYYLTGAGALRPDQTLGIAFRLTMQFKFYVMSPIIRLWGRERYGQGGGASGLVQSFVAATVLGSVAEMLRDIAKIQDPIERFHHDPVAYLQRGIVRGGAAGAAGDFMFGEFSRNGQRLSDYFAGPTIGGTGQDMLALFTADVRHH